jgi:hypothetical protein
MIEIHDGELRVYPVAESDVQASQIMDALRFAQEDHQ